MPIALLLALVAALLAIGYGGLLSRWVLSKPQGDDKMRSIAKAIQEGAGAYLLRQTKSEAVVAAIVYPSVAVMDPKFGAFFGGESVGLLDYFARNWYWIFGVQFVILTIINMSATAVAMRKYLKV